VTWLFLSSGARPPYIENVARSLALFPHEHVQVRYDEKYVSPLFAAADPTMLRGQRGYLAFLGKAAVDGDVPIVPVREVTICRCEKRGSSYVIRLSMGRYLYAEPDGLLIEEAVRKAASEALPTKVGPDLKGFWASRLTSDIDASMLVPHGYGSGSHLKAFEQRANLLSAQDAFASQDRRLFLNVLDLVDSEDASVLSPNRRTLKAGERYRLIVYHYFKDARPEDRKPYWLGLTSRNSDLQFRSEDLVKIESPYDERQFSFEIAGEAESQVVNLDLRLAFDKKDGDEVMSIHMLFDSRFRLLNRVLRIGMVAAGLTLAQCTVLFASNKLSLEYVFLVFLGSLIAAFAAVLNMKKSI